MSINLFDTVFARYLISIEKKYTDITLAAINLLVFGKARDYLLGVTLRFIPLF